MIRKPGRRNVINNTKTIQNMPRVRLPSIARTVLIQQEGKGLSLLLNLVPGPQHKPLLAPTPAALLKSQTIERQQMTNTVLMSLC